MKKPRDQGEGNVGSERARVTNVRFAVRFAIVEGDREQVHHIFRAAVWIGTF